LFLTILVFNLLGLLPYFESITATLFFTSFFSITSFLAVNITAFSLHGLSFFAYFLPSGTPT